MDATLRTLIDLYEFTCSSIVAWGRVRAGRAEGQELMLEVVAAIVGQYAGS